ncbi:MAG TPA: M20/M25/M40 family metallo-hydrolase [Pyrinomonadaceae bacterium]|nr:M20/M25/M40 family metallo-hydrolase [Pyrinomonadaceae bacterium]
MKSKRARTLSLFLLLALCAQAFARQGAPPARKPSDEVRRASSALAGSVLVGGRSWDYLKGLADGFGGRLSGSPAYERSAEWAAERFRAAGLKDVRLEEWQVENTWQRGTEGRGRIVAPVERRLNVESLGWSPSTPPGGVRGEVVIVEEITREAIRAQAARIKGRVVMLDIARIFAQGEYKAYDLLIKAQPMLKEAGALALVFPGLAANDAQTAVSLTWGTTLSPLPAAMFGMEDSKLIKRLLTERPARPVTVEFSYENRTAGRATTHNVVAEIRGRERPDEWVILGAHLDSWDFGTGAQDNGSGVAQVLEAARAIASMPRPPRRSIRFALWGGEEQGLLGSEAYARAHAPEMKNCVAALNTDNGAGHPRGWKYEGREDVRAALEPLGELLAGLGGEQLSPETTFDTDHGHFMLAGVPALDMWVDMTHYEEIHHKASDTLDKVNAHDLAAGAAVLAVTAYAIAEQPGPFAPRLEHKRVGEILKRAGLEEFLTSVGVWKP